MKIRNQAYAGKELFYGVIFQWKRRSISKTANLYVIRENKKIFFSWNHSQTYRCFSLYCICVGFRSAIVCLADVTMRKLKIHQTLLAFRCYLKNGHRHKKAFLSLKVCRKWTEIVVFKRKKAFCTKKNLSLDEVIVKSSTIVTFPCGIKVSYR